MQRTIKALAVLVVGLAFLVPPPPAYGEEDTGGFVKVFKNVITPTQN